MNLTPAQQSAAIATAATATDEINHYLTVYTDILSTMDPIPALVSSAEHILNHNRELAPQPWALEVAVAVRLIHQLRTELAELKTSRGRGR